MNTAYWTEAVEAPARRVTDPPRSAAITAFYEVEQVPTSLVEFRSRGLVLVVGTLERVRDVADRLPVEVPSVLLATDVPGPEKGARGQRIICGKLSHLTGYLGRFDAFLSGPGGAAVNLAELAGLEQPHFDLVLDLAADPLFGVETPPLGYFRPESDAELAEALALLPEMAGQFDKPKFFNLDTDICAHGASGLTGCTRCLDGCTTGAITSLGDMIEVNPYLCQGVGVCVSACPSGALSYAFPQPRDLLKAIKAALAAYFEAGGKRPVIALHDEQLGARYLGERMAQAPENLIPVQVEETASVGMDVWLAALAYGAAGVILYTTPAVPQRVTRELDRQLDYARSILTGMGHAPGRLSRVLLDDGAGDDPFAAARQPAADWPPASFLTFNAKRNTLGLALDHLFRNAPAPAREVALAPGAPFGEVLVNTDACTLCMACAQVCPSSALTDNPESVQLRFIEDNCVQCGLCQTACPEEAVSLRPRLLYDGPERRQARVLNEEAPFHCVSCGAPFATASVITRMLDQLSGHRMFQSEEQQRRLQMCGDCRVRDMFRKEQQGEVFGDQGGVQ
ncbi:4Fe-4S binding protein [Alkalilimnicola ehrlichii MLHE-1]|uniref:4Fe-4S ferredoxin, iron-sulfur binding domain protein n=1 Tax=Alkalilimnicola ehrlichii (strain ATCC BAA-1101 / DSM 17681 / MLHE-1) TaxID=187272 RepID=Q0A955_ALKEH|nr:4Fe-4S binding protein [Alkalilimnicola ehrlichii]ABI56632.1 4Fe-4S ferredoxin, iron-sulfur binding domain protein [Alkalilimnicola ehrlichii MLHE-1]